MNPENLDNMRTLVFIPAFNEEGAIATVVREVRGELPGADVLVVDDGSTDRTAAVAREAGAVVASLPFNQGIGAAVQTGYLFAGSVGYDYVGRVDGDGQHPARELARVLEPVRNGDCDVCIGSRFHDVLLHPTAADVYKPTLARRIGITLFRSLLSRTSGQRFTDPTSGLCAVNRRGASLFAHRHAPDYPELELLQRASRQGLRIAEITVTMRPRLAGRSSITPLRSAYFIFKALLICSVGALRGREHEQPELVSAAPAGRASLQQLEQPSVEPRGGPC
jgi:glycosyltransferase involved in cell wall biosynthesis